VRNFLQVGILMLGKYHCALGEKLLVDGKGKFILVFGWAGE
jgi:hypothetical protein